MIDTNHHPSNSSGFALSDEELNAVAAGAPKAAAPVAKPTSRTLFEIEDYSFDIEQVLN